MKKVTIIIPCYNESKSLPMLYEALEQETLQEKEYHWEYLFINDGSKDETLSVLEELHKKDSKCCYVDLSRNYGKEVAMLAGFDYAKGDCAIIMDADLQHPPYVIHNMLRQWEAGYEDVYAKRDTRGKESWLRKRLSLTYYKMLNRTTRVDVLPNVGDFRLLDRCCLNALCQLREQNRYTKGMFCYIGFKKTYVTFETQDRVAGESSMSYSTLLKLAIEGFTSYTTAPLRLATVVGFITSIFAFLYAIFVLIKTLVWGDSAAGFPTLIIIVLFLGGIQLLSLGIIGEYLGRVFNETKNRPAYFVETYNGKKE